MENNGYKDKVREAYAGGGESNRAKAAGEYGLEFIYTKKLISQHISKEKKVIEVGCGGGYYGLEFASSCREYLGVDLSPINVEMFREQIREKNLDNVRAEVGDATDLKGIETESYDLVLCLGPLYHLNREDRQQCIRECKRICKKGGIILFAFINKAGAIAKFSNAVGWENMLTEKIDDYVLTKGTDDVHTNIFYYTMPEEILEDTADAGLEKVRLAGVDFLVLENTIASWTDEQRRIWSHLADIIFESEYATALTNHAVLVCRS